MDGDWPTFPVLCALLLQPQTPETDEEDESGLDPLFYLPSTHVASKLAPVAVVVESDKKRRTATWFLLTASAVGVASTVGLLLSV